MVTQGPVHRARPSAPTQLRPVVRRELKVGESVARRWKASAGDSGTTGGGANFRSKVPKGENPYAKRAVPPHPPPHPRQEGARHP